MKIYQGVIVPMVTPLNADFSIDTDAVTRVVDHIIKADCSPFVLGTTGEAASFSSGQKLDFIKATSNAVNGRQPLFAGISGTSLFESVEQAKAYRDLGADVMVTTLPYYYPITPDEMIRFFEMLADQVSCPMVIYNMPAMVGASIPLDVADQLSHHPNIVGMKDSERDIDRINKSLEMWSSRDDFSFYLGWAAQSAHCMLNGADGIVPSTANFVPDLYQKLYIAGKKGDKKKSQELQKITDELSLIYQEGRKLNASLPALKVVMDELGLCQPYVMPPMYTTVQDDQVAIKKHIRKMLADFNLNESKN